MHTSISLASYLVAYGVASSFGRPDSCASRISHSVSEWRLASAGAGLAPHPVEAKLGGPGVAAIPDGPHCWREKSIHDLDMIDMYSFFHVIAKSHLGVQQGRPGSNCLGACPL